MELCSGQTDTNPVWKNTPSLVTFGIDVINVRKIFLKLKRRFYGKKFKTFVNVIEKRLPSFYLLLTESFTLTEW